MDNLKPFQKGYDPRRQIGRKKGSKNVSTVVDDILRLDFDEISNEQIKKLVGEQKTRTIKEAIVFKMAEKSLNGDLKSAEWLFKFIDRENSIEKDGFFDQKELKIHIIEPKQRLNSDGR